MAFKVKYARSTVTPLLTHGGQNVRSMNRCRYLEIVLDIELSDDRHAESTAILILCSKQAACLISPMFKCS